MFEVIILLQIDHDFNFNHQFHKSIFQPFLSYDHDIITEDSLNPSMLNLRIR